MTAQAKYNHFTPEELQAVIEGIKSYDKAAGEQFYQWFKPMVWRYAHRYTVVRILHEDAENILWLGLLSFVREVEFTNYTTLPGLLKKVVIFTALDAIKNKGNYDPNVCCYETLDPNSIHFSINTIENTLNKMLLAEALRGLSAKQRTLLFLYYEKNLTFKQIALRLNLTERKVRYRHYKILYKLKLEYGFTKGR